jgi:hypothetical protein
LGQQTELYSIETTKQLFDYCAQSYMLEHALTCYLCPTTHDTPKASYESHLWACMYEYNYMLSC